MGRLKLICLIFALLVFGCVDTRTEERVRMLAIVRQQQMAMQELIAAQALLIESLKPFTRPAADSNND